VDGDGWRFFYERYHQAVAAMFRRTGARPGEVEDLVQEFFATALQREFLDRADRDRGRFRGYLATAARRFMANRLRDAQRARRKPSGGLVGLEAVAEPSHGGLTPEEAFDLEWARAVLARAVARARAQVAEKGKEVHADAFLIRQDGASWQEVAQRVGSTIPAVKGWVSRFRKQVATFLREEVAGTVASEADLQKELDHLSAILAKG
jgi:RNA polymerase sigma-70 factor (ECF subfamily)